MDLKIREIRTVTQGRKPLLSGREAYPQLMQQGLSPSDPFRYLRESDRIHIADRLREKSTVRALAGLGRSPSTVSLESCRNRHPANGQYRSHAAQAHARRPRSKPVWIGADRLAVVAQVPGDR